MEKGILLGWRGMDRRNATIIFSLYISNDQNIGNNVYRVDLEGSHSGLVRPPAKRVGGDEPPRGFESRTLRHKINNKC